jgi:hypothetical protein
MSRQSATLGKLVATLGFCWGYQAIVFYGGKINLAHEAYIAMLLISLPEGMTKLPIILWLIWVKHQRT